MATAAKPSGTVPEAKKAKVQARRGDDGVFRDVDGNIVWDHQEVDIEREGSKIILPNEPGPMPLDAAIASLQRLQADEETVLDVHERIDCFPLEGAVAFYEAMRQIYGWASPTPKMGFFGPIAPDLLTVQVDVNKYVQVPWGEFKLPNIENNVGLTAQRHEGKTILILYGQVRKREKVFLMELAAKTRKILREDSIYLRKAIHIRTSETGELDLSNPPSFLDVMNVDEGELILNRDVEGVVKTNIYALIEHTAAVRRAGIPLKRGILLSGKYGVGKTMLSRISAKKCITNGWTFINVDSAKDLKEALLFANRYQPAVVFCEDIDRHMETRDDAANELLNTVDGIISKNTEIMVVLTTNNAEKIEPAMLRPGRLDAVISVSPPDAESVQRLIKLYARGLLAEGQTLDRVGEALAGNIPAVVREVVEKSKLSMIAYDRDVVLEEDLLNSYNGMTAHLALLDRNRDTRSDGDLLAESLRKVVGGSGAGGGADSTEINKLVQADGNNTRRLVKTEVSAATAAATQAGGAVSSVRQKLDKVGGTVDKIADEVGA